MALQATVGFVQVRLDLVAISSSAYPGICSGLTNIAEHLFLLFNFIKSQAAVPGGRNAISTPAQSPNVVCYQRFAQYYIFRFDILSEDFCDFIIASVANICSVIYPLCMHSHALVFIRD